MAGSATYDSRVGRGSRVVIPAAVRDVLGLTAGDRVQFQVSRGGVHLVTAETMLRQIWSHNPSAADQTPTSQREDDQARQAARWQRLDAAAAAETRPNEEIEASLSGQLGLAP